MVGKQFIAIAAGKTDKLGHLAGAGQDSWKHDISPLTGVKCKLRTSVGEFQEANIRYSGGQMALRPGTAAGAFQPQGRTFRLLSGISPEFYRGRPP
mgnify:CR=1 FL=1